MTSGSPEPASSSPDGGAAGVPFFVAGGRYAVEVLLGAGAGGEVFAGRDTLLERPVAIKRLPAEAQAGRPPGGTRDAAAGSAGGTRGSDAAEAAARLLAEARAIARLSHPNIVAVHDVFEEQGRLHLVLERVPGATLRQRLSAPEPLGLDELVRLAGQLAAALAHAHAHGIVHRDVKPENVLLVPGGVAKLVDFGIARVSGAARLTNPDEAVGTPAYVAPEQATGGPVDGRADLYALGCVLYEAATGAPPFEAASPLLVISQHLYATPAPPSAHRPDLPPAWDALILRLLAKRPEDRLPSAEALLDALASIAAPRAAATAAASGASPGDAPPASAGGPAGMPAAPAPAAGPPRILVVDDDRDLAEVIEFVLRRAGYAAEFAYDGRAGWERFVARPPDLVVLDVNLPGLDGFELLRRIRARPGPEAATPVVMLTAHNDEASVVAALDAGADDYIAKPFSPRQLVARLRAALRHGGRVVA